jgi:hypothetical protein
MDEYENIVFKLASLASNIEKEVVGVLDSFLFSLKKYEEKNHNVLSLMLDPIFKSFCCVSLLINCEQMKAIVEEYNTKFLYPCFKNVIIIYTHWVNLKWHYFK